MIKLTNFILILANVLIFIVFQTVFFYFVGSQQMSKIIKNKTDIINKYLKISNIHKYETREFINSNEIKKRLLESKKEEKERKEKNIEVIKTWIGPPLIIVLMLLFICITMLYVNKVKWTGVDSVGLTLVVTAYVTEIVIFLGIIKKYEFLGDQPLYYFIYNLIKKEVNKLSENKNNKENCVKQLGALDLDFVSRTHKY